MKKLISILAIALLIAIPISIAIWYMRAHKVVVTPDTTPVDSTAVYSEGVDTLKDIPYAR